MFINIAIVSIFLFFDIVQSLVNCIYFLRVPEKEFLKAFKAHPRLKTKVNNFHRQGLKESPEEDFVAIRSEWITVDRIIACRFDTEMPISCFRHCPVLVLWVRSMIILGLLRSKCKSHMESLFFLHDAKPAQLNCEV